MTTLVDTSTATTLECVCGEQAPGIDRGSHVAAPSGWLRHYLVETGELLAWCPRCSAVTRRILERRRP